jgi:hypothetical protein
MGKIVWLASYPKSGNTWLRAFLHSLLRDPQDGYDINRITDFCANDSAVGWYAPFIGRAPGNWTEEEVGKARRKAHEAITKVHPDSAFVTRHAEYAHERVPAASKLVGACEELDRKTASGSARDPLRGDALDPGTNLWRGCELSGLAAAARASVAGDRALRLSRIAKARGSARLSGTRAALEALFPRRSRRSVARSSHADTGPAHRRSARPDHAAIRLFSAEWLRERV